MQKWGTSSEEIQIDVIIKISFGIAQTFPKAKQMRHSRIRNTEGNITFRLEEGETFLVLRCLELNLMFPCRTTNMSLFPYQSPRRACWKANLVHCLKKAFRWWFLDTWQLTIFSLFFIIFFHCKFARKYKSRMFSWKLEKSLTNILTAVVDVCHSFRQLEEERDFYIRLLLLLDTT